MSRWLSKSANINEDDMPKIVSLVVKGSSDSAHEALQNIVTYVARVDEQSNNTIEL